MSASDRDAAKQSVPAVASKRSNAAQSAAPSNGLKTNAGVAREPARQSPAVKPNTN